MLQFNLKPSAATIPSIDYTAKAIANKQIFWLRWMFALAIVAVIFSATMEVAPILYGDEFMNIDLGRMILNPDSDWSICWMAYSGQPVFFYFYLGTVLQEIVFQIVGQYGPRILTLIGALVAATAIVRWLIARGTSQNAALILGLVFLLDPLFVQAYTMGRLDSWTMALCITSCWILRNTSYILNNQSHVKKRVMFAGALASLAFFIWPSAVFLFPLILFELISLSNKCELNGNWKKTVSLILLFGISALIIAILLLLPFASHFYAKLYNVIEALKTNVRSGPTWGEQSGYLHFIAPFIELLRALKYSPVLFLIALISAIWRREVGLVLAIMIASALMLSTLVYMHRVQYLLPYLISFAASFYQLGWKYKYAYKSFGYILRVGGLAGLLVWSISLSICIRSILALDKRAERSRDLIYQAAQSMIGPGKHSVLAPLEFYYTGRTLGWKMYKPYLAVGEPMTFKEWESILPLVNYVIVYQEGMTEEASQQLKEKGMRDGGSFYLYADPIEKGDTKPTNVKRIRNLYQIFRQPYGPYKLYVRETNHSIAN